MSRRGVWLCTLALVVTLMVGVVTWRSTAVRTTDGTAVAGATRTATSAAAPVRPPTVGSATPPSGRSLEVGVDQLPVETDPGYASQGFEALVWRQVFETLTTYRGSGADPHPQLATEWRSETSDRIWVLTIAEGHVFHDGTPVTADAVCTNFEFWFRAPPDSRERRTSWSYYFGGFAGDADSVYRSCSPAASDITLTFEAPLPDLPDVLADISFGIHEPSSLTGIEPIGSGPFKWVSGSAQQIELVSAGPRTSSMPRLTFREMTSTEATSRLQAGTTDLYYSPYAGTTDVAGVRMVGIPKDTVVELHLHAGHGPLADDAVRGAVYAVLDQAQLAGTVGRKTTTSLLPSVLTGAPFHRPASDVAAATKLLRSKRIALTLVASDDNPESTANTTITKAAATALTAAGVTVKVRLIADEDDYYDAFDNDEVDISIDHAQAYRGELAEFVADYYSDGFLPAPCRQDRLRSSIGRSIGPSNSWTAMTAVVPRRTYWTGWSPIGC